MENDVVNFNGIGFKCLPEVTELYGLEEYILLPCSVLDLWSKITCVIVKTDTGNIPEIHPSLSDKHLEQRQETVFKGKYDSGCTISQIISEMRNTKLC